MERQLSAETAWIDALMAEEELFDRLVELDGGAARFQRVLMDEAIARRLCLADVAAMLGIAAEALTRLAGGEALEALEAGSALPEAAPDRPEPEHALLLDTRPIFDSGHEPLPAILDAAETLAKDAALLVVAPFHPLPLRRLLGRRGFASSARERNGAWQVTFVRQDARRPGPAAAA